MSAKHFVPVRVSTLRGDLKIPFDAYVHVAGKHILYCRKGDSFEGERLDRLRKKKLKKMFILEDHESLYRNYMTQNIEMAYDGSTDKPMSVRAEIIQGAQQAATEDLMDDPESKAFYEVAKEGSKRYLEFIQKEGESLAAVLNIKNSDSNIAHHGVSVATLAVGIAEKMGLTESRPELINDLAMGCLVHDLEHQYSRLNVGRPLSEFSESEMVTYKSHPESGASRVNTLGHFDPLVVDIIMQHEECIDGSGFPRGLVEKDLDDMILVASTANTYDRYITFEGRSHKDALKAMLIEKMGLNSLPTMQALQNLLKDKSVLP